MPLIFSLEKNGSRKLMSSCRKVAIMNDGIRFVIPHPGENEWIEENERKYSQIIQEYLRYNSELDDFEYSITRDNSDLEKAFSWDNQEFYKIKSSWKISLFGFS